MLPVVFFSFSNNSRAIETNRGLFTLIVVRGGVANWLANMSSMPMTEKSMGILNLSFWITEYRPRADMSL